MERFSSTIRTMILRLGRKNREMPLKPMDILLMSRWSEEDIAHESLHRQYFPLCVFENTHKIFG